MNLCVHVRYIVKKMYARYVRSRCNSNSVCAIFRAVEVKGTDQAEQAIEKMDRFEINGRKIIVREVNIIYLLIYDRGMM